MIKAILYDLDGVLVNATEWHYASLNKALEEVSGTTIERDEHISTFNGLPTKKKLETLVKQGRVKPEDTQLIWQRKQDFTKETIFELAQLDPVKLELHEYTRSEDILSACVTNSITETASLMLKCTGQLNNMQTIITNEDVKNPKPHGEGYIRAMLKFGFEFDEYLIVEDSPVGLQAAASTGTNVWQVTGYQDVTKENLIKHIGELNG